MWNELIKKMSVGNKPDVNKLKLYGEYKKRWC